MAEAEGGECLGEERPVVGCAGGELAVDGGGFACGGQDQGLARAVLGGEVVQGVGEVAAPCVTTACPYVFPGRPPFQTVAPHAQPGQRNTHGLSYRLLV